MTARTFSTLDPNRIDASLSLSQGNLVGATTVTAHGGSGGAGSPAGAVVGASVNGGAAGTVSTNDLLLCGGQNGGDGFSFGTRAAGGYGADSIFGGSGTNSGGNALANGAGGGGNSTTTAVAKAGGNGGAGCWVVEEYS